MNVVAGIVDIVGSREVADRVRIQAEIKTAFAAASRTVKPVHSLWATVGDEFQIVFRTTADAIAATTLVRLILDEADLRIGLGLGDVRDIDEGATGPIQDGSAWIHARAAIDEGHKRQAHMRFMRSWFCSGDVGEEAVVNAALLSRDHIITRMKTRERRIAAASLSGATQVEIASALGVSQSAVSQSLNRSGGGALLAAQALRVH